MIESVPLIQNANDAQQINASIIAMKKASKELDEKILKLNNLNKELDKKIAVLDNGLAQEITDRENADSTEVSNRNTAITNAVNALDVAGVGGSGKYISAISESNGKINATVSDLTSVIESGNNQPATSGGVFDDSFLLREEQNSDIDNYPIDGVRAYRVTGQTIGWVANDGLIINIPWPNDRFGAQIAIDDQSNWLAIRTKNQGVWNNWDRFVKASEIDAENNDDDLVSITSQLTNLMLGANDVSAYKKNNMIYLHIQGNYTGTQTSTTQRLLEGLPQKYRPKIQQIAVGLAYNSVSPNVYTARLVVYPDGHIDMSESGFPNNAVMRIGILYVSN